MGVKEDKMRGRHKTGQVCEMVAGVESDAKSSSLAAFVFLLAVSDAADGSEIIFAEGCIVVGQKSRSCAVDRKSGHVNAVQILCSIVWPHACRRKTLALCLWKSVTGGCLEMWAVLIVKYSSDSCSHEGVPTG